MLEHHMIHYDDFDDPVLPTFPGHGCAAGHWTVVYGTAEDVLLRNSEAYLAPTAIQGVALRTDIMESDDLRIESLARVRGDCPYLEVYVRWDGDYGKGNDWLRTRFIPASNDVLSSYYRGGEIITFTDANFPWNIGDEIFFEIWAIQRDVMFRTSNLTLGYTTHADYRIPDVYSGFPHYAGLAWYYGPNGAPSDSGFDYFKVFPAGEPVP